MKLQPNFSWQKYEGAPEDQKQQFQYQLQSEHIQVANSVNATIDDASYFTKERETAFTWIDGKRIWTKTITGTLAGGPSANATAHGITNLDKIVLYQGTAQKNQPLTLPFVLTLPYVSPTIPLDGIGLLMDTTNVYLSTGNGSWNGYPFSITIYYTKIKT